MSWTRAGIGVGGSGSDPSVPSGDHGQVDELEAAATVVPPWRREPLPVSRAGAGDRVVGWVSTRGTPLAAGFLCLAGVGVLVANTLVPMPVSAQASPDTRIYRAAPASGATPALVSRPGQSGWSVSAEASLTLVGPGVTAKAGVPPVVPDVRSATVLPVLAVSSLPDAGGLASSTVHSTPATRPVTARPATGHATAPPASPAQPVRVVVPAVAAPVVPMTAAEQTAANALAAANLTAANALAAANLTEANALAAANLTAANAAAAAAETARVAAAAAEATRLQALADAYAVAHPGG